LVAGWDFSQSCLEGNLCDTNFLPLQTLPANYSDLDPTNGMGAESANFGTMLLDGSAGSSNVPGFGGNFTTVSPSLTLNTAVHTNFPVEMGAAGNGSIMQAEIPGVPYQEHAMRASVEVLHAVFMADLSAVTGDFAFPGATGSDWEVSFAAQSEGASSVTVGFSPDGISYTEMTTQALSTAEQVVTVPLGGTDLAEAYVRLSFDGAGEAPTRIDHLAIHANLQIIPEPGTMVLLGAGFIGLAYFGRRRS
jgi:hypothetical protein